MTIAQRAALVEKERTERYLRERERERTRGVAATWDGLDSLGSGENGKVVSGEEDDWGLADFVSASSTPNPPPSTQMKSQALWDLHEFAAPTTTTPPIPAPTTADKDDDPAFDLDFGDREDRLLDPVDIFGGRRDRAEEDDILGVLAKPVDVVSKSVSLFILYDRLYTHL
jgi:hypothetical protein